MEKMGMNVKVVASHTYAQGKTPFASVQNVSGNSTLHIKGAFPSTQNRNRLSVFVIASHVKAEGLASAITAESKIGSITCQSHRRKPNKSDCQS